MLFDTFSRRMKFALICLIVAVALFLGICTLLVVDTPYIYNNYDSLPWIQMALLGVYIIASAVLQTIIVRRTAAEIETLRSTTDSKIAALEARIAELEKKE